MPVMLINLRGVPEDEANEIRELLQENDINFYETPPGNWGISMPALWVKEASQKQLAEPILQQYHQQRAATARAEYKLEKQSKTHNSFFKSLRKQPLQKLFYLAFIAIIIYFSTKPFLSMGW